MATATAAMIITGVMSGSWLGAGFGLPAGSIDMEMAVSRTELTRDD